MLSRAETEFLMSERVARIATINAVNETPHIVPVCFAFDGEAIFTSLNVKSKRLKNIEQGSALAILVDEYKEEKGTWKILRGLLIHSGTRVLSYDENEGEFMYGWRLLIQKYPQYKHWANADLTPKDPDRRRIVRIKPTKVIRWGFM
ncbi:MAG: pyridoxamine 5'-phosphate oxidase family protein [Candidatus Bathyarchaeia archaeon]